MTILFPPAGGGPDAWKQRLLHVTTRDGQTRARKARLDILARVRTFYLDMQEWALEDASWAAWAVPGPIRRGDLDGFTKQRRQTTSEMHQRVRDRLPQLPLLVQVAERHHDDMTALLAAVRQAVVGDVVEHNGHTYRRLAHTPTGPVVVSAQNLTTGGTVELVRAEDDAFWAWAIIEILRHTGVRREELLEITHLALVSYRLPATGEIVPLLQIMPSKVNEERPLLVTPELASVLASIISRVRGEDGKVPLVTRYDPHERTTGPALPHLFQRRTFWRHQVISTQTMISLLNQTIQRAGMTDRAGQPMRYTPHDFRRIFATDAVTGGLPVHIAAKLLGHHSLAATQSYLAVFQDDLIRTYRASSTSGAPSGPRRNTASPPQRNGASSNSTSGAAMPVTSRQTPASTRPQAQLRAIPASGWGRRISHGRMTSTAPRRPRSPAGPGRRGFPIPSYVSTVDDAIVVIQGDAQHTGRCAISTDSALPRTSGSDSGGRLRSHACRRRRARSRNRRCSSDPSSRLSR